MQTFFDKLVVLSVLQGKAVALPRYYARDKEEASITCEKDHTATVSSGTATAGSSFTTPPNPAA